MSKSDADILALLNSFCCKDEISKYTYPFNTGSYSYATDRVIIIRVPLNPLVTREMDHTKHLEEINWDRIHESKYIPLPELPDQIFTKCMECDDASGKFKCDCEHCKGHACDDCEGTGKIPKMVTLDIAGNFVSDIPLRKIKDLECVMISSWEKKDDPVPFKFNGGFGFIKPCKERVSC